MSGIFGNKRNDRAVLGYLRLVGRKNKLHIIGLTALQMILGGCGVLYALILREIVNGAAAGNARHFWGAAAGFVALTVVQLLLVALFRYLNELTRASLENALKQRLFDTLLTKDFGAVSAVHSAKWMNYLTSDTAVVANQMTALLPGLAGMLVQLFGALWAVLVLEPKLAWLIFPVGLLLVVFSAAFRRRMKALHKQVQETDGELRLSLQEQLSGMTVVRAYSGEEQARTQAAEKMADHKKARMRRCTFSNLCNVGFGAAMRGGTLLGAIFCGYGILSGTMSVGNLVAVMQLMGQVQGPMANLSGFVPQYYSLVASTERLMEAESLPQEPGEESVADTEAQRFYAEDMAALELEQVDFAYGDAPKNVLENFSLLVKKKEYVAFTGHSGCGKSTVFRLLLGLYIPQKGQCAAVDHAGKAWNLRRYRRLFAYVPQGKFFMSGTIRDAVTFSEPGGAEREAEIWQALETACAAEFVRKLEQGLDTPLGEQGLGLSEGQLQRLAIARAIFSRRPVLLLDEATSALDEATEKQVLSNLRVMTDRTVLIVTHRPAALEICDRVIDFGA